MDDPGNKSRRFKIFEIFAWAKGDSDVGDTITKIRLQNPSPTSMSPKPNTESNVNKALIIVY